MNSRSIVILTEAPAPTLPTSRPFTDEESNKVASEYISLSNVTVAEKSSPEVRPESIGYEVPFTITDFNVFPERIDVL